MIPVTPALDELTRTDLADLVAIRRLGPGRAGRMVAALAGGAAGGHDRVFRMVAFALHAAAVARGGRTDDLVAFVMTPEGGGAAGMRGLLGGIASGGPATADAEGLAIETPGGPFRLTYGQIADAAALTHFLMVADGLERFGDVVALLGAIDTGRAGLDASVAEATRALSRIAYGYRTRHFPERDLYRRNQALIAFLSARFGGRARQWRCDDDAILAAFEHLVAAGERPLYATVARRCLQIEQVAEDRQVRTRLADGAPIEDIAERLDAAAGGGHPVTGDDDGPLDWLAAVPETPKVLTGPERALAAGALGLAPMHRDRALTVLRAVAFGALQDRLARGGAAPDLRPERGYGDVVAETEKLVEHLVNVAVLIVEASGAATADLPRLRRIRREGFQDRHPSAVAADLADARGPIAGLIAELRRFAAAAAAAAQTYDGDVPRFARTLAIAYSREGAQE